MIPGTHEARQTAEVAARDSFEGEIAEAIALGMPVRSALRALLCCAVPPSDLPAAARRFRAVATRLLERIES